MTAHDRARRLVAIRHEAPLPPREEAWLQEHLARCELCARVAEGYAEAEAALYGGRTDGLNLAERERIWSRLAPAVEKSSPRPRRRSTVVAVWVAAATLTALFLFPKPPSSPDEFQARGEDLPPRLVLRALVITSDRTVRDLGAEPIPAKARIAFLGSGPSCPCSVVIEARVEDEDRVEVLAVGRAGKKPTRVGPPFLVPSAWAGREVILQLRVEGRPKPEASVIVRVETAP